MSILKQLTILILTGIILILCNCFNFGTTTEEKKNRKNGERFFLLELITLNYGTKEEGIVMDNKDGTLTYTYRFIQTNGIIGNKVLSQRTILIRRCLIGQVYRTTQNDCQGTGTKDTVWGASQLQWCPTNDRSCEKDGKADSTISPAAKACATDTFAGKKWELASKDDGLGEYLYTIDARLYNEFRNYYETDYSTVDVWLNESLTDSTAAAGFGNYVISKNRKLFLFCKGIIS